MTSLHHKDLITNNKLLNRINISCPCCENKKLRAYGAHFQDLQLKTKTYESMIAFCEMCNVKLDSEIFSSKSFTKQNHKKASCKVYPKLQLDLFCSFCRGFIKLYIEDRYSFGFLDLSWVNPRKNIASQFQPKVEISFESTIKQRRLIPLGLRYQVLVRDNHTCQCCGAKASDGVQLHIDHIKPVSKGGTNIFENLQVLCRDCNLGKGNKY